MSYRQQPPKPVGGFYPQTKVYSDGSHYIAIPHTERPYRPKKKRREEVVVVREETDLTQKDGVPPVNDDAFVSHAENNDMNAGMPVFTEESSAQDNATAADKNTVKASDMKKINPSERKMTKRELFNELYVGYLNLPKRERREKLIEKLRPYFKDEERTATFVDVNLERKRRNLIARRIRLTRKVNLAEFNYFVTFTYNSALHTEESFKKKLRTSLRHLTERKSWKYIGVWERSPEKKRLHFHGIFNIPEGTMPGNLVEKRDYNTTSHCMKTTVQNTYFNERFGRSDFEKIEGNGRLGEAVAYIMKYIEKSGEKIVYSRGLPQFFISDISEEDIVTKVGVEDSKLLLFDNFTCWDEGEKIGEVSADTIKKLRKSN